jgi:hypothetical protein
MSHKKEMGRVKIRAQSSALFLLEPAMLTTRCGNIIANPV